MEKETAAPAVEATGSAEEITGLPVQTERPSNVTGTVAEMLSMRKADTAREVKEEDKGKEKQLDDIDKQLRDMLFKGKKKDKKEPAKPAKEEPEADVEVAEEEEFKPAAAPEKAQAKSPTKKAVVRDRAAELKERELELEKQRLELERERLELEKSKAKPAAQESSQDLSALSSDERYELEIFQVMAKLDPSKHGDLPKRFTDVVKATAKYKAQWEKDNPGESFDPDDSAHDDFFSKNQVKYEKKDFKRAELKLANEGETDPKVEKLEKENQKLMAVHKLKELEPRSMEAWGRNLDAMIEDINPDIVEVVRKGGKAKLLEDYPVEGEEILRAAEALSVISIEAFKLLEGDGLFEPDHNNRIHGRILDVIRKQEQMIPAQPRENRLDPEGRDFATWSQWVTLSPQQQANYWHLGAEEVMEIFSRDLGGRVKYELERIEKLVESKNKRTSAPKPESEIKEKPAQTRSPGASPGSASKSTVDTSTKPGTPAEDKFTKTIRSALFKRPS